MSIIAAEFFRDGHGDVIVCQVKEVQTVRGTQFEARYEEKAMTVPTAQAAASVLRLWLDDGTVPSHRKTPVPVSREARKAVRRVARIAADHGREQALSPRARYAKARFEQEGVLVP